MSATTEVLDLSAFDQHAGNAGEPAPPTGRQVAVVGAGVAGMACAIRLALLGNGVVLYEARSRERMLETPPADLSERESFERMVAQGRIRCEYGRKLGLNLALADLHLWHDAVFLGVGLASSRVLALSGSAPAGLFDAGQRVAAVQALDDLLALPVPQRAIVIGASRGAVGMAARLKQLGAQDVTLALRHALAPDGREEEVARACFVRVRGWVAPLEVLRDERGAVETVRFEQTRMLGGRVVDTGGFTEIAAHAVFKAVGRAAGPELDPLVPGQSREGDRIEVDGRFRTALPGIYAGGDCVAPRLEATQARRHGLQAAQAIHADLLA
ncbi:FAD-dependent oxidoreductase [Telluria beijingensis]|uniref:FAD-dependent oxidoreductase n=1 Tax=Telluria beijingensis TaxID=3068633 RepID=UPI0027952822|nr:FAD-dependent oxidoreductase [Massilia sp. REN29]